MKPGNTTRLEARIREAGGCVRKVIYPGIGHIEIMVALAAAPLLRIAPVLGDVADFVEASDRCVL